MRISGSKTSSVILSQTMKFKKLKSDDPKVPKQAEAKRDGVINLPKKKNPRFSPLFAFDFRVFCLYLR